MLTVSIMMAYWSQDVRERLEKRRKADVEAIEKKKDSHIEQLMKNHEKVSTRS